MDFSNSYKLIRFMVHKSLIFPGLLLCIGLKSFAGDGLPTTPRVAAFFELVHKLSLNSAEVSDGSGGISVDLAYKAEIDGKKVVGNFLSTNRKDNKGDNGTGNPEGHIVSFNLARVLGISEIYSTGKWYQINGKLVESLHRIAKAAKGSSKARVENRNRVIQNTSSIDGKFPEIEGSLSIYMEPKLTLLKVGGSPIENPSASPNGRANESNKLVRLVKGDLPTPTDTEKITVGTDKGNFEINTLRAVKDLSAVFIIDAILEQGDRFSGGNIDLLKSEDGSLRIASLDNGAAAIPGYFGSYTKKYLSWIGRIDKNIANRIIEMDLFLQKGGKFLEFTDQNEFLRALGLRLFKKQFVLNVHLIAQHIKALGAKAEL